MTIEGRIESVMESWPPQLRVQTARRSVHVALRSDAVVEHGGERLDVGQLRTGMRVRIEGRQTGLDALAAQTIVVLEQ